MPTINWTAVAVIAAMITPLVNSWFQHWLKTRSEKSDITASASENQPKAITHEEIAPLGIDSFFKSEWRWTLAQLAFNTILAIAVFVEYRSSAPITRRSLVYVAMLIGVWAYFNAFMLIARDRPKK